MSAYVRVLYPRKLPNRVLLQTDRGPAWGQGYRMPPRSGARNRTCPACLGARERTIRLSMREGGGERLTVRCPWCYGTGLCTQGDVLMHAMILSHNNGTRKTRRKST